MRHKFNPITQNESRNFLTSIVVPVMVGTFLVLQGALQIVMAETRPPAQKWAVIIGINDYLRPEIQDLGGCENDATSMHDLLIHNFGFPQANIKMLLSGAATKQNIRQTIKTHLLANEAITPDDIVIIYYAGHGSQQRDQNGDEPDGWDETIVPHDARPGVDDIADDEIGGWVRELRQKTTHLTLIFDSCHSGSATRDPYSAVRYTPPQTGERGARSTGEAQGARVSDWMAPSPGYVLISGCRHYENSHEFSTPNGNRGVMSFYLQQTLAGMRRPLTYLELMEAVRTSIEGTRYRHHQSPIVEGDLNKQIFSGVTVLRPLYFRVTSIKNDRVKINAGAVHLMTKGSILGAYPKTAESLEGEKNCFAKLIVEEVFSTSSQCRLANAADSLPPCAGAGKLSLQSKIVELQHDFGALSLHVSTDLMIDPALQQTVAAMRQRLHFIKLMKIDSAEVFFSARGDSMLGPLMDPLCVKTREPRSPKYVSEVETELLRLIQRKNLSRLNNNNGYGKLALQVEVETLTEDAEGEILDAELLTASEQAGQMQMAVGQAFQCKITNLSKHSVWISVLSLQSDGGVSVIYPPPGARDNYLPPDGSFVIPSDGIFRVTEPLGVETLTVIGTTKWTNFKAVEIPGCSSEQTLDRGSLESPGSPLEALFAHPLAGQRAGYEPTPIDDWTAISIRYEVVEGSYAVER